MKTCYKCKETKSKSEFYKDSSRWDKLTPRCKPCINTYDKVYCLNNGEKISIKSKNHYVANRESIRDRHKHYYETNKIRIAVKDKRWSKANPDRKILSSHKRRVLKRNSEDNYTVFDIKELLHTQQCKCVYCQIELITEGVGKYHIDHIMPLFLGGANSANNLQLLCPFCNLSKGYKHPDVYEKEINYNRNKE